MFFKLETASYTGMTRSVVMKNNCFYAIDLLVGYLVSPSQESTVL